MQSVTSVRSAPASYGTTQQHNARDKEYMSRLDPKKVYIRQDLTSKNKSYIFDVMKGQTLDERFENIHDHVLALTGKDRDYRSERIRPGKGGKPKKIRCWSPIREHILLCNENTTIEDLKHYASECQRKWGITPLQIFLHKDEGYYNNENKWIPHVHAHITFEYVNRNTCLSIKDVDTSQLQDLASVCLGMERGESKEETQREHLERTDYIIKKRTEIIKDLEQEADEKRDAINRENGNDIVRGLAGKLGLNTQLKEEKKKKKELQAELNKLKEELKSSSKEKESLIAEAKQLRQELKDCRKKIKDLEEDIEIIKNMSAEDKRHFEAERINITTHAKAEGIIMGINQGKAEAKIEISNAKEKAKYWHQQYNNLNEDIPAIQAKATEEGRREGQDYYKPCYDLLYHNIYFATSLKIIRQNVYSKPKDYVNRDIITKTLRWLQDFINHPIHTLGRLLVDIALIPIKATDEAISDIHNWIDDICNIIAQETLSQDNTQDSRSQKTTHFRR